jgi:hypothetical protein
VEESSTQTETALVFLDEMANIEVPWHMEIKGNDRAGEIAKG